MWTKENIPRLTGKTAIVTGANAGVGYETALALYEAGAHVVLACRSMENAEIAIAKIMKSSYGGSLEGLALDLSSLQSVATAAATFTGKHSNLNILINNAGVMYPPASKTVEGFELQFGTNFLGHFTFTGYLYPLLKNTKGARVVTVSSNAYKSGKIDFDNLRMEIDYDPVREYGRSKLANLLFAFELQRMITAAGDKVLSIAAQPGANNTSLSKYMDPGTFASAVKRVGGLMEPWQGALPSLYAATDPNAKPGGFYEPDKDGGYRGYPAEATGVLTNALDEDTAKKLWKFAEENTGIVYP
jgi:NAD(P)-dependent dehydrogenase (short-subunit alcohol dehydrogenase family)